MKATYIALFATSFATVRSSYNTGVAAFQYLPLASCILQDHANGYGFQVSGGRRTSGIGYAGVSVWRHVMSEAICSWMKCLRVNHTSVRAEQHTISV